jgi:hypothetical protein
MKRVKKDSETIKSEDIAYLKELYGANFETQSHKKLWNYFTLKTKTNYFRDEIARIRQNFNIPETGFEAIRKANYAFKTPEEWKNGLTSKEEGQLLKKIWSEAEKICKKFQLHAPEWKETVGYYIFYNKLQAMYGNNAYNLCVLRDVIGEEKARRKARTKTFLTAKKLDELDLFYPIAIRVSPYATERDIIDYVKKMSSLIKEYQKPYMEAEVKIGKVKKRKQSIQERNEFIYDNRHLSLNDTKKLVEAKFVEVLDYEYIGKIRSEEAKRRQEV